MARLGGAEGCETGVDGEIDGAGLTGFERCGEFGVALAEIAGASMEKGGQIGGGEDPGLIGGEAGLGFVAGAGKEVDKCGGGAAVGGLAGEDKAKVAHGGGGLAELFKSEGALPQGDGIRGREIERTGGELVHAAELV